MDDVDPTKAIRTKGFIEPGSLKAFRPESTQHLWDMNESTKEYRFSLMLIQSREHFNLINTKGGSILSIKTQRYETLDKLVLEIGWAYLSHQLDSHKVMQVTDDGAYRGQYRCAYLLSIQS